jgi:hypothetical protein
MFSGVRIDGARLEYSRGRWSEQPSIEATWPDASCAEKLLFLYPVVGPINLLLSGIDQLSWHLKVVASNYPRLDIPHRNFIGAIFAEAILSPDSPRLMSKFSVASNDRVQRVVLLVANGSIGAIDTLSPRAVALEFASGARAGVDLSFGVWGGYRYSSLGWSSHSNAYVRLLDQ